MCEKCLSQTASPLSLTLLLGLLLLLLVPEAELTSMVTLSGQRNMQEAGEQRIQKDGRRRLESLLPLSPPAHLLLTYPVYVSIS